MSEDYSRNEKEKWISAVESITIAIASLISKKIIIAIAS